MVEWLLKKLYGTGEQCVEYIIMMGRVRKHLKCPNAQLVYERQNSALVKIQKRVAGVHSLRPDGSDEVKVKNMFILCRIN